MARCAGCGFLPRFSKSCRGGRGRRCAGRRRLVKGGSGELAVSLEVDEEVENLAWFEIRKRSVGEMVGELRGPAEVSCNGAAAQSFELDEAEVVLIPRSRRVCVYLFFICVIRLTARVTLSTPNHGVAAQRLCSTSRSIQRRATLQFEFELPSPPWMRYTFCKKFPCDVFHS